MDGRRPSGSVLPPECAREHYAPRRCRARTRFGGPLPAPSSNLTPLALGYAPSLRYQFQNPSHHAVLGRRARTQEPSMSQAQWRREEEEERGASNWKEIEGGGDPPRASPADGAGGRRGRKRDLRVQGSQQRLGHGAVEAPHFTREQKRKPRAPRGGPVRRALACPCLFISTPLPTQP